MEIPRLEQKIKRFSTLVDVNVLINSSLDLDQILDSGSVRWHEKSDKILGDNKKNIDAMMQSFRGMSQNLKETAGEGLSWKLIRKP